VSYEDHLPTIVPPWLAGPTGRAFFGAVGALMDQVRKRLIDAVKARLPSTAASDALAEIGRDRGLPQGAGESMQAFALRLIDAWTIWGGDDTPLIGEGGGAGSHLGMLRAIKLLGLPTESTGATIVQQNGRYAQLSPGDTLVLDHLSNCINRVDLTGVVNSRPGWTFEGRDNFYSEFAIIFPANVPALTVGSPLATALNDAVKRWKPGKMVFVGTFVIESGITLGWPPGRTLGTDPNLGGNVIRYLPPAGGNPIHYNV
jgi:hypothetical protein